MGMVIRCPRLGHEVNFAYCRQEAGVYPCERVIYCWQGIFKVDDFFREKMGASAWEEFKNRVPSDKITNLLDLMEQVRSRRI
ncbi:MAG: hypothetical protein N2572_06660 [Syntrophales bacterium]|nr:hypothetical protein [Syntrophales bacterium]